jgi:hypothetical protein
MNIHLPAILMFTRGIGFWPIPILYVKPIKIQKMSRLFWPCRSCVAPLKDLEPTRICGKVGPCCWASALRCGLRKSHGNPLV